MENRGVLIDSSLLIEHLRKKDKTNTRLSRLIKNLERDYFISSVTCYEVLVGLTSTNKEDVYELFRKFEILDFDFYASEVAAKIYKELKSQNKLVEVRDIFIASIAISKNLELATLNYSDYDRITKLKIIRVDS